MGAERIIFLARIDFIVIVNYIYNVTGRNKPLPLTLNVWGGHMYKRAREEEVLNVNQKKNKKKKKEERNLFIL